MAVIAPAGIALADAALDEMLAQDVPYGDLTTEALGIAGRPARIRFAARGPMVACAGEEAAALFARAGAVPADVVASGTAVEAGAVLLTATGTAGSLHRAWKVAQTLMEYASGIATRARRIVDAASGAAVACTRKSFPGAKPIAVKAVQAGGASMHRLGLSETLLVFPEHRAFLDRPAADWIADLKRRLPEKRLVVETDSVDDAVMLAEAGADVIQLEKLPPEAAARVVARTRGLAPAPVIAAAGGVDETNAAAYAAAGCAVLVTSAPYFAKPADVAVTLEPG